jgi:uncharacterized membrane protein
LDLSNGREGDVLALYGLTKRQGLSMALGLAGVGMVARAVTNIEMQRLLGTGAGRRAITVQKTIDLERPIEEVFDFWMRYEHFPRFMTHIREVRDLGERRSHRVTEGPAGASVSWDATITQCEPNRLLAWRSTPDSMVEHAGIIYFDVNPDNSTRVHMRLSYNPPAGAVGHAVAWLFGKALKTELDEDLVRLRTLLETGKTRAVSGELVWREDLAGKSSRQTLQE